MKVTASENIRDLENDLIEILTGDLDWEAIEKILRDKYNLSLHDDVEYQKGDIVVHNNRVAYKLNFDVKVTLSLLFGRDGECLEIDASGDDEAKDSLLKDAFPFESDDRPDRPEPEKRKIDSGKAAKIAELISEINK